MRLNPQIGFISAPAAVMLGKKCKGRYIKNYFDGMWAHLSDICHIISYRLYPIKRTDYTAISKMIEDIEAFPTLIKH